MNYSYVHLVNVSAFSTQNDTQYYILHFPRFTMFLLGVELEELKGE
jgi:hypothetical protein